MVPAAGIKKAISRSAHRGRDPKVGLFAMLVTVVAMCALSCLGIGDADLVPAMDAVLGTSLIGLLG